MNDVYPNELIEKVAEKLKSVEAIKAPVWAAFAKTGAHNERAPLEGDWWYTRAAAVLRSIAILGPIGVSKLRTKYGGKKRRGHKKAEFRKGSGSVIRKILQQLEKAELIKFSEKGVHKGRVLGPKGKSLLDKTAAEISKAKPKAAKKKAPEVKKEEAKPKEEVKEKVEEKKPEPKVEAKTEEKKPEPKKEAPKKEEPKVEEKTEEDKKTEELKKKLESQ